MAGLSPTDAACLWATLVRLTKRRSDLDDGAVFCCTPQLPRRVLDPTYCACLLWLVRMAFALNLVRTDHRCTTSVFH